MSVPGFNPQHTQIGIWIKTMKSHFNMFHSSYFLIVLFIWDLIWPRLASKPLDSWDSPWLPDSPASTSQILELPDVPPAFSSVASTLLIRHARTSSATTLVVRDLEGGGLSSQISSLCDSVFLCYFLLLFPWSSEPEGNMGTFPLCQWKRWMTRGFQMSSREKCLSMFLTWPNTSLYVRMFCKS